MDEQEVQAKVDGKLAAMAPGLRDVFLKWMVTPFSEGGYRQQENVWIVAVIPEEKVCVGYSETGYDGFSHLSWGLLWLGVPDLGGLGNWYRELDELIDDSGYL